MRTFSSAENRRRVRRWISRTTCSVLAPLPIGCLLPVGPGVSLSSTPYVVHIALTANTSPAQVDAESAGTTADLGGITSTWEVALISRNGWKALPAVAFSRVL